MRIIATITWQDAAYGLRWHTEGFMDIESAQRLKTEYIKKRVAFVKTNNQYSQYVDLRGYKPGPPEAQTLVTELMKLFISNGGLRSVVVLDSVIAAMQIKRLSLESGIYSYERYITSQSNPDFEKQALAWLIYGKDPDK